jgi:hypothetical protein
VLPADGDLLRQLCLRRHARGQAVNRSAPTVAAGNPALSPPIRTGPGVGKTTLVNSLLKQGRMHHIGSFPQLEDQMTNFTSDFDRDAAGYSPDRLDALVWAATELLIQPMKGWAIFELYRQQAEALAAEKNL